MQRRDFLKYSVALGVASALPLWSRAVFAAERPTLPIPDLLTTDARNRIQLTIGAGQSTFGEKTATTWGYNGNLLGPAVKLQRGKAVTVDIYNQLTEETTLHWHGLEVPGEVDGGPQGIIPPGGKRSVTLNVDQPAATCWFHPHQHGKTGRQVAMVEIDASVVSFCRQYLPNHNAGSYDDPRFKLVIDDGVNFVNQTNQTFDVIISDCTDPIGPGESLFTSAFYEGCKRCLNPGGIFVAQNGVCFLQQEEAIDSHRKLSHYFSDVGFYQAAIPTYYGGIMTFAWATDNDALRHLSTEIIQARFLASGLKCRYYNPAIHTAAFALPQYLQDALASQPS